MITSPLLSDVHHGAMITPLSPLLTRLIHISPSCWAIYCLFEIITVRWIGLQIQSSIQIHCFQNIQSYMNYVLKNTKLHRAARALMDEPV